MSQRVQFDPITSRKPNAPLEPLAPPTHQHQYLASSRNQGAHRAAPPTLAVNPTQRPTERQVDLNTAILETPTPLLLRHRSRVPDIRIPPLRLPPIDHSTATNTAQLSGHRLSTRPVRGDNIRQNASNPVQNASNPVQNMYSLPQQSQAGVTFTFPSRNQPGHRITSGIDPVPPLWPSEQGALLPTRAHLGLSKSRPMENPTHATSEQPPSAHKLSIPNVVLGRTHYAATGPRHPTVDSSPSASSQHWMNKLSGMNLQKENPRVDYGFTTTKVATGSVPGNSQMWLMSCIGLLKSREVLPQIIYLGNNYTTLLCRYPVTGSCVFVVITDVKCISVSCSMEEHIALASGLKTVLVQNSDTITPNASLSYCQYMKNSFTLNHMEKVDMSTMNNVISLKDSPNRESRAVFAPAYMYDFLKHVPSLHARIKHDLLKVLNYVLDLANNARDQITLSKDLREMISTVKANQPIVWATFENVCKKL